MYLEIEGTNISVENTLDLKNPFFRYPSAPVQTPPGQYHDSPTEQYWNGLPNEQGMVGGGPIHPNANPYSPNCNINNNLSSNGDYDGNRMATDGRW